MHPRRLLAPIALLAVAGVVVAGCGESQDDAERAFCADLASFRSSVTTLTQTRSLDAFRAERTNVDDAWQQLRDSANNAGTSHFDEVSDAWDTLHRRLDGVKDLPGLVSAAPELRTDVDALTTSARRLSDSLTCSDGE